MKITSSKTPLLLILSTSLISCAVSGFFTHYSSVFSNTRNLTARGEYQAALNAMPNAPFGKLLDSFERGRLAFLVGDLGESETAWQTADELIKEQQNKAIIQISEGLNQAGALLSNDNILTYSPSDYELGFFHLYRALYFLRQQNLSSALVEIRRANQVQEDAKKSRQEELKDAEQSIKEKGLDENTNLGAVLARYPSADKELSAVQNGYLFFLSALLYEAEKNPNSAFIDYSRALTVAPDNRFIAHSLMQVAKQQGRVEELRQLEKKYGKVKLPSKEQGQLVILLEKGLVKQKSGWRIPFIYGMTNYQFANLAFVLPYYAKQLSIYNQEQPQPTEVELFVAGNQIQFELLVNVNAMAEKALSEAIPAMVVRQVLRLLAKTELIRAVAKEDKTGLSQFAASVYSVMSEQPDTRSWQTLPERVELFSQYYSSGEIIVDLAGKVLPINIEANKTTLLWLSKQGENFTHWQEILGEI